ncbi:DUF3943 domain-containing protein [Dechloromonas sp. XY25]|uniref:DUF3943 domain-containing protein n=1 Tax=Dechloromonas hankyongensis TaxID=2908002 RepID=A0ABS9K775_9RHOO|nr:DUF3943 domain-containing protein [Dechloromonas hankyongensis]MCG2579019.1 DUF3943 domain-containing protein [Dechloromonas hankyongensis]
MRTLGCDVRSFTASACRLAIGGRPARLAAVFALGMASGAAAWGETGLVIPAPAWAVAIDDAARPASDEFDLSVKSGNPQVRKNFYLPAAEIIGFEALLNLANRRDSSGDYKSNLSSIRRNLGSSWNVDHDPFRTNQLGHPYAGSMYHTFARSLGHDYWESLAYTFAGSALWEIAGERTRPSRNDQINTGIGGTFLGEALFRLSNLMLEPGGDNPPWLRELGAALISPATGFNRLVFRERMDAIFASRNPAYYGRLQLGFSQTTHDHQVASASQFPRNEAVADFSIDYGLPGKPGYAYTRPFDYFNLQATVSSANGFESLMTRGLLLGTDYEAGANYRGIFGLYGSYDYLAPQIYRVSSTALSVGTTAEFRLSESIALQGTGLLGVGYAAVGSTRPNASDLEYHYGLAPQALIALRAIFGNKTSLDLTAREYFVSRIAADSGGGRDNIIRVDATVTMRLNRRHAISVKYLGNRRDASFAGGDLTQTRATVGIFYTYLGQDGFGKVDWH